MPRSIVPPWARVAFTMFGVGWGANQFAPLLRVYRTHAGLSETDVTAMFGVYALGLIPALLITGSYSDAHGRRTVLRPVVTLSALASLVLIAGGDHPVLLYVGRFLAGVASGAAFSAGSAWVKELSSDAPPGTGAKRAAIALSAGFGGGPLVAGAIAQWLPWPTGTPYLVHLALIAAAGPLVWNTPDPQRRPGSGNENGSRGRSRTRATWRPPRAAGERRFAGGVASWAPWVFGTATIGFATLPALVADRTGGLPIAFSGMVTGLTLFTGVLVQPLAGRLAARGAARPVTVGLLLAAAGLAAAAVVADTHQVLLVPPAAMVLGASYGILLVSGLREVERTAPAADLGALIAVFYALIYVGFGAPYLLAGLSGSFGYAWCLVVGAAIALALIPVAAGFLRVPAAPPPAGPRPVTTPRTVLDTVDD